MEGQNHISQNSHSEKSKFHSPKPHSSPVKSLSSKSGDGLTPKTLLHPSKDKVSMNSTSQKSTKYKDGKSSNHLHSKPREHSSNSHSSPASIPKHKDGSTRPKDPHLKPKDANSKNRDPSIKPKPSNMKPKDPSHKPKDPSLKPKDSSSKPRDPSSKPRDSSSKPSSKHPDSKSRDSISRPKDPNLKHKDPNLKQRDPSLKPKDPNLKPKDPSLKSKDPSLKHKEHSSKSSDPNRPRDPNVKPKDPNQKPRDPNKKLKEGYIRMKDGTVRLKDPNAKSSSSSGVKSKTPSKHSISSSSRSDKPSSGDSAVIKKEKRPDGVKTEVKKEGHSVKRPNGSSTIIKREGEHTKKQSSDPSKMKIKVKTENDGSHKIVHKEGSPVKKIKTENGTVKVKTPSPVKQSVKKEPESDDDEVPLNQRLQTVNTLKRSLESEDDEPLTDRIKKVKKQKTESDDEFAPEKPKKRKIKEDDEDFDNKPLVKKKKKDDGAKKKKDKKVKKSGSNDEKPSKKKKKEEEQEVWKWWEEEPLPEGVKWKFLQHMGPVFAAPYDTLPPKIKFHYDGNHVLLSPGAEEVAGFYARMLDHDYTTKEIFNKNFFRDWRKSMTQKEQAMITDLKKCNFSRMHKYFLEQSELRKNRTKEEKKALKEENEKILEKYGFCNIDGHKEKIGNFKIEPPGLFRGRGDHPKMGMLKKRILPGQVTLNCSKDAQVPTPPEGHKWKAVVHDDKVTWLCSWSENIQGSNKYVMLNPSSRLKGEKDWMKYETARKLKKCVGRIRDEYRQDWKSKEMRIRQRAVALYFIDKLALRAGNEKEEGETADTVGCCSLRVEHTKLYEQDNGQEFVVEFDFLGKDSIRYQNKVPVEKRVFKNLQLFVENKKGEDDLFDRLNTSTLNKYLQELMDGLTAKVFRTFNASSTLQTQLNALTVPEDGVPSKILAYNRANRAVAVLCNHQRAAPKTFDKQMANLNEKVQAKIEAIKEAKKDLKSIKNEFKQSRNERLKQLVDRKKKTVERLEDQLSKLEMKATDKEENKEIALGTSKLNYLDPRISVAWCKKWEVPMEKVYNRTQRDKFRWAIDMAGEDYEF